MSAEPPSREPRVKARLPFEPQPFKGGTRPVVLVLYAALTLGLLGLALYMGLVERLPLTSGYVAAPAIGALWFGLRLFMVFGSRR
ncbi:MAG: hypothetical protein JNJ63_09695 [Hyphomonadaceae bacterium]|nr:hypothetical protein [Hyphomonadaceae bacterium]